MSSAHQYAFLEKITELYKPYESRFDDVYILACQHVLEPQAKMFELIADFGMPRENIRIFGKIYSTSNEVVDELLRDEFKVSEPVFDPTVSFDVKHHEICKKELIEFLAPIKTPSKIIVLDDGGELLKIVNDSFEAVSALAPIFGVEQTSSGFRKLEHAQLHFPIYNVARSSIKLIKESPLIAELGCGRIVDVVDQYRIADPRFLVVGLGPLGANTLSILEDKGYYALGYDIAGQERSELIDLIRDNQINIVVGVTGTNIIDEEQLQKLVAASDQPLYLISMSSADREFPATYIRQHGVAPAGIHSDVVWNNLVLINNGFPITFKGKRYESTPAEIERTIGLLYGSTLEAMAKGEQARMGFVDVPAEVENLL